MADDKQHRGFWGFLSGNSKPTKPAPSKEVGSPGFSVYGGYITDREQNSKLTGSNRWKTYNEIVSNTSIIAAGVRSFFNLIQRTEWTVEAALDQGDRSSDEAKELAEWLDVQFHGLESSWSKVITKASSYKFNGFSWSEWTAMRNDDGTLGLLDVRLRPAHTIERWDIEPNKADILGAWQRIPNTGAEVYIPRWKSFYLVDDILNDDPRGMGLLRHCVDPASRLKEYLRNEGMGIQRDLRGLPVISAPINELNDAVEEGSISSDERDVKLSNMMALAKMESKNEDTGILLDSEVYFSETETGQAPSSARKWNVDILSGQGSSTGIADTGASIERLNNEMARVLGVEHLMLGGGSGSHALSEDKSRNFFLQMEGTLQDIQEATQKDLIDQLWTINGFDPALKPSMTYEGVQFKDVQKITASLRDMATAGAVLDPRDPIIDEVRSLMGFSPQPEDILEEYEDDKVRARELAEAEADAKLTLDGDPDIDEEEPEGEEG